MKILVLLVLFLVAKNFAQLLPNRQAKKIAQRRQLLSYSNNVLHQTAEHQDQAGESSVKVSFNPKDIETKSPPQYYNNLPRTRTIQDYVQQPIITNNYQNYQHTQPQTQLFNVGYSVKFTNDQASLPEPLPTRGHPNLDEGEIITGIRKQNEEVQVPDFNTSPQEFVSSALIENKKAKLSGIKPKNKFIGPINVPNPKLLLNQANLSPATQKQYKALQQLKLPAQNHQELQHKYSWRNLSPSVEIIQSTEVPVRPNKVKYIKSEQGKFDHVRALGRSQEFDYTNALEVTGQQSIYGPQQSESSPSIARQIPLRNPHQQLIVPVSQLNGNTILAKLPMDTSLLREPVRIDTRLIQEAIRQNLANYQYPSSNLDATPQDYGRYQTIHPQQQQPPLQQHQQQNIGQQSQLVNYNQEDDGKNFQDYQQSQSKYQYKIYGKPQPVEPVLRQPRYADEYNLQTNLRPPPLISTGFHK